MDYSPMGGGLGGVSFNAQMLTKHGRIPTMLIVKANCLELLVRQKRKKECTEVHPYRTIESYRHDTTTSKNYDAVMFKNGIADTTYLIVFPKGSPEAKAAFDAIDESIKELARQLQRNTEEDKDGAGMKQQPRTPPDEQSPAAPPAAGVIESVREQESPKLRTYVSSPSLRLRESSLEPRRDAPVLPLEAPQSSPRNRKPRVAPSSPSPLATPPSSAARAVPERTARPSSPRSPGGSPHARATPPLSSPLARQGSASSFSVGSAGSVGSAKSYVHNPFAAHAPTSPLAAAPCFPASPPFRPAPVGAVGGSSDGGGGGGGGGTPPSCGTRHVPALQRAKLQRSASDSSMLSGRKNSICSGWDPGLWAHAVPASSLEEELTAVAQAAGAPQSLGETAPHAPASPRAAASCAGAAQSPLARSAPQSYYAGAAHSPRAAHAAAPRAATPPRSPDVLAQLSPGSPVLAPPPSASKSRRRT